MNILDDPYASVAEDGRQLFGGETVTFGKAYLRYRTFIVEALDGPMVWIFKKRHNGKVIRDLVPAAWLSVVGA